MGKMGVNYNKKILINIYMVEMLAGPMLRLPSREPMGIVDHILSFIVGLFHVKHCVTLGLVFFAKLLLLLAVLLRLVLVFEIFINNVSMFHVKQTGIF